MNHAALKKLARWWLTFLAMIAAIFAFVIVGMLFFTLFVSAPVAGIILLGIIAVGFFAQMSIWVYREYVWDEEFEERARKLDA